MLWHAGSGEPPAAPLAAARATDRTAALALAAQVAVRPGP